MMSNIRLSFEEFKNILQYIYNCSKLANEYTENLRNADAMFANYIEENDKVEFLYRINDKLMTTLFGDMVNDISWFLYEWKPEMNFEIEDRHFVINNIDDFCNYIEEEYYTTDIANKNQEELEITDVVADMGIVSRIKGMFGL